MADLATTIHETIERHRYAVPAGEMSYRPGDPICSCGWRPPKPNGELHSRHVATEVARAVLACLRDLTPTEQADAIGGLIEVQWMCEPLRFRVVGPWRERVLVCTEVSNA